MSKNLEKQELINKIIEVSSENNIIKEHLQFCYDKMSFGFNKIINWNVSALLCLSINDLNKIYEYYCKSNLIKEIMNNVIYINTEEYPEYKNYIFSPALNSSEIYWNRDCLFHLSIDQLRRLNYLNNESMKKDEDKYIIKDINNIIEFLKIRPKDSKKVKVNKRYFDKITQSLKTINTIKFIDILKYCPLDLVSELYKYNINKYDDKNTFAVLEIDNTIDTFKWIKEPIETPINICKPDLMMLICTYNLNSYSYKDKSYINKDYIWDVQALEELSLEDLSIIYEECKKLK